MTEGITYRWILGRFLMALPVVFGVTAVTFLLIHLAPGDPILLLAGDGGSAAYYADMRAKYGLDQSLAAQFLRYVHAVLSADFGYSFMYQAPVVGLLRHHAAASVLLGVMAVLLATGLGFFAGGLCAVLPGRAVDVVVRTGASLAYAAPVFWTGQVFILIFAVKLGLFPASGLSSARESLAGIAYVLDVARHLALPALTLALPFAANVARVSRASMLEALREPFVRASYARGFTKFRVVTRHVAANAVVPVAALVGQQAAQIIAGAALTEALFGWPGIGYLVLHASLHRDYPLVTAAFLAISCGVVFVNALADIWVAWLDPRIRLT